MSPKPRSLCKLLLLVLVLPLGGALLVTGAAGCSDSRSPPMGGQTLFASRCAFCHGNAGRGDGHVASTMKPAPRDFTNPEFWKDRTRTSLEKAILEGVPGSTMSSHRGTMSDEELDGLVDFLMLYQPDGKSEQDEDEQEDEQ